MLCYLEGSPLGPHMCDSEMQRCCHQGDQMWIRQCWGRLVKPASWFTNELLGVKHLLFAERMQHFSHRASFPCSWPDYIRCMEFAMSSAEDEFCSYSHLFCCPETSTYCSG